MNIYDEYAKAKLKIKLLQLKLKELEPEILEEIKDLSEPMRTNHGLFTRATREYWKYSKKLNEFEKEKKVEVEHEKEKERENGEAKKEEKTGLRFIETKEEK